jgi:hypothetical protein
VSDVSAARRVSLAAVESRLRSRRGLLALWLVTTLSVALVTVLMERAGVPGWDDAAHAYKVFLLRRGDSVFWDTYWYGGGYGAITYGFLFYWLAQYVSGAVIVVIAAGTVPVSFYLYVRDLWKIDDVWPAWGMALVMVAYLAHGQDPFVLALALTLAGLALLAGRHPVWGALCVAVGIFSNPMGLVVVTPFVLTDLLCRPAARRGYVVFLAVLAPAVVARFLLGWTFSEPGSYLNESSQLLVYLGFALVGVALAGVNAVHPRRPFIVLYLTYAVLCVGSFATPGSPLGNNIGRFFMVFGLPLLLLLRHTRLRRPARYVDLAVIPIVAFALLQFATATSHYFNAIERPQTTRAYFAPALTAARELYDPNYRFHVVALRRHWEALYFPEAGYPITRGWYRQADAIHNSFFYKPYDAAQYEAWLQSMGVQYVFLPVDGPLDPWSKHEAGLLAGSPAFTFVQQTGAWRIYRLVDAEPLLVPTTPGPRSGTGSIIRVDHERIDFSVSKPGTYWLKFTSSPYWELEGGPGKVTPRPDRFMDVTLGQAGGYSLRFVVTPAKMLDVATGRLGL